MPDSMTFTSNLPVGITDIYVRSNGSAE